MGLYKNLQTGLIFTADGHVEERVKNNSKKYVPVVDESPTVDKTKPKQVKRTPIKATK